MDEVREKRIERFIWLAKEAVEKASNTAAIEDKVRHLDAAHRLLTDALDALGITPISN
jgi:hypothetical protein